jgi:hypothetical protein
MPPISDRRAADAEASSTPLDSIGWASLPPWRRLLATLNWHPTIDARIRALESERREQESELRTKLIENDIEQLMKENKRLADIESRLDALLLSADSSSPAPPATDSN